MTELASLPQRNGTQGRMSRLDLPGGSDTLEDLQSLAESLTGTLAVRHLERSLGLIPVLRVLR
jgi:hypothetical protein